MTKFKALIHSRWPHIIDGRTTRFMDGVTEAELKRYALESQLDDKIMVRAHLQRWSNLLPKLLYSGFVEDLPFDEIPPRYVIKPRCQTGSVMIVDRGMDLVSQTKVEASLIRDFFASQWCYRGLNNEVVVEDWVAHANGELCSSQAKCYVVHGEVKLIMYKMEGWHLNNTYTYDRNWYRVYSNAYDRPVEEEVPPARNLDKVIQIAEELGKYYHRWTGINQVRVDLFDTDAGPKFGEFTGGGNAGEGFTEWADDLIGASWSELPFVKP